MIEVNLNFVIGVLTTVLCICVYYIYMCIKNKTVSSLFREKDHVSSLTYIRAHFQIMRVMYA